MRRTGDPVAAQAAALALVAAATVVAGIWHLATSARRTLRAVCHVIRQDRSARAVVEAIGLAIVAAAIFYACACVFLVLEPLA